MRLGVVILPDRRWREAEFQWRHAEELGFSHAWTYDHLAWRMFRDEPWMAAVPTLAAAAMATQSIGLGCLVASPNFRHPVPFAKEMVALDDLSDGRLTVGLGAGGSGWDTAMLGQDRWLPRERADRFGEFVEVVDLLLREGAASYEGVYYTADEASIMAREVSAEEFSSSIDGSEPLSTMVDPREVQLRDEGLFGVFASTRLGGSSALLALSGAHPGDDRAELRNPAALGLERVDHDTRSVTAHALTDSVCCTTLGVSDSYETEDWCRFKDGAAMSLLWESHELGEHSFWLLFELAAPNVDPPVWLPAGQIFEQQSRLRSVWRGRRTKSRCWSRS